MRSRLVKQNSGFTLIELMITIALASVLLGIGIPSFMELIRSSRLSTASNEFISSMHLARSEAVKRRADIIITVADSSEAGNEWGNGWRVFTVVDTSGTEITLKDINGIADNTITMDSPTGVTTFTYSADGMLDSNIEQKLNICANGRADGRQITIEITGRTSVDGDYASCPE